VISHFVSGAIVMAYVVAALHFLRFWRETRDRLFAFFAWAFVALAVQRLMLELFTDDSIAELALYGVRALAFLSLAAGILDKNRRGG
jgi:hypothetical protein